MSKTFLTKAEIVELTGKRHKNAQIQQLTKQRIKFVVAANGQPVVLREAIQILMGVSSESDESSEELFLG